MIMDLRDNSNQGFGAYLTNGRVCSFVDDNGVGDQITTTGSYNDNLWHSLFICISKSGATQLHQIYVDGSLALSGTTNLFTNTSVNPRIGTNFNASGNFYVGSIKFPFWWRISLTPTQVKWQHETLFKQINL